MQEASITKKVYASSGVRMARVVLLLALFVVAFVVSILSGYQSLDFSKALSDEATQTVLFKLRLPRVLMAAIVGASLALVGASLQALFRNPLAEPLTLGVSGGAALGASIALGLGLGASILGVPLVFVAAFGGALISVVIVYRIARASRARSSVMPGTLLLAGVIVNIIAASGVIIVQYLADYTRALQILRWTIGSLDIVGFGLLLQMMLFLAPGWLMLLYVARDLHLLAIDEETAASLGVNVRKVERGVYLASSLIVGTCVAVGGTIGFVGLIVPHGVRLLFGEDVRRLLPLSMIAGAAFLMLADTFARTAFGTGELPVGAITALAGGPVFLWLLKRGRNL